MIKKRIFARILLALLIFVAVVICVPARAFALSGAWVFDYATTFAAADDNLGYDRFAYTDDSYTYFYDYQYKDENYQPLGSVETLFTWQDPPASIPLGKESEFGLWLMVTFPRHPGRDYYNNDTNKMEVTQRTGPRVEDINAYYESLGENGDRNYAFGFNYDLGGVYGTTDLYRQDSGEVKKYIALHDIDVDELEERSRNDYWNVYYGGNSDDIKYQLRITIHIDNQYSRSFVYVLDKNAATVGDAAPDFGVLFAIGGIVVVGAGVVIIKLKKRKPSQAKPKQETISYQPEVTDWRGNKIDEGARVRQTHQEYTKANRDAQAEYDAQRRAEESALRQHEEQQLEMLEELIRLNQRLSTTKRELAGKMNEIIHKQLDTAFSGNELDPAAFNRIAEGFGDFAGGKIIGADDIPPMPTTAQLAVNAYEDAFEEVCRNQTATAVAVRTVSSVLSGGVSDKVFQVGKGFYRAKDYIDEGGDSTMGAITYALFGEARDRAVNKLSDKVMWKLPFTPKGGSLPKRIMYDQRKRYVKQAVNAADKATADTDDQAQRLIRWIFE